MIPSEYLFEIYPLLISWVSAKAIFLNALVSVNFIPPNRTIKRKDKTEIRTDRLELTKSLDNTNVKSNQEIILNLY